MIGWQGWTDHERVLEAYGYEGSVYFYAATWDQLVYVLREAVKFTQSEDVGLVGRQFPVHFEAASFEFLGRPSKELLIRCLNRTQFRTRYLVTFELLIDTDLVVTPSGTKPWCAECGTDAKDHGKFHFRTKALLCSLCTTAADARRRLGERRQTV